MNFMKVFINFLKKMWLNFLTKKKYKRKKAKYPFYTIEDIQFRLIRDEMLKKMIMKL